jgi:hypothetical protein
VTHGLVDPGVDAERQAIVGCGVFFEHRIEPIGIPAHEMDDRADHLAREPRR